MKSDSLPGIDIFRACEYVTHMTYVRICLPFLNINNVSVDFP